MQEYGIGIDDKGVEAGRVDHENVHPVGAEPGGAQQRLAQFPEALLDIGITQKGNRARGCREGNKRHAKHEEGREKPDCLH